MGAYNEQKASLLREAEKLHRRLELSKTVGPDWYEPGQMEFLDQSEGFWDETNGTLLLRFESRGTRYDGRTELIERLSVGTPIKVRRDPENPYNPNNFVLETENGEDAGNMPAELCNAIAPLYDAGRLSFERAAVSYAEPISIRSRYAQQGVLFVELLCAIRDEEN